jgi:hypothetical protein
MNEERPPKTWDSEARTVEGRGDETLRLAQLGELTADELATLRERANEAKLRVGTDAERISGGGREHGVSLDQQAVELWKTVEAALKLSRSSVSRRSAVSSSARAASRRCDPGDAASGGLAELQRTAPPVTGPEVRPEELRPGLGRQPGRDGHGGDEQDGEDDAEGYFHVSDGT